MSAARHLLLLGLPGAGKSTVARHVADRLGVMARDLDDEIEREAGRTVRELFEGEGEAAFRSRERNLMARFLDGPATVIAPGGGWAAQPGELAATEGRALTIYLSVPVEVAAKRLGAALDRPLLVGDPLPKLRELLARRERWYRLAGMEIEASGPSELVAEAVLTAARLYGGWLP